MPAPVPVPVPAGVSHRTVVVGHVPLVEGAEPDADTVSEADQSAADLVAGGRVAGVGKVSPLGPLYAVEDDAHGRPTLTRTRFTL